MKVREQAIKELGHLQPDEILKVYNLILSLKSRTSKIRSRSPREPYMRVREALKKCKRSIAEDIISSREDRV